MKRKMTIKDENDFNKKYRSLRKYCMRAYKDICFGAFKNFNLFANENGLHKMKIVTDYKFEKLYGKIELVYRILDDLIIIEDILPNKLLLDGYEVELTTYNGVPVRNEKDIFKLKMIERMY